GDVTVAGRYQAHVPVHPGMPSARDASSVDGAPLTTGTAATLTAMTALGQAGSGFLVAGAGDAVVLVDPHVAHEKVLYTELLTGWRADDREASGSQLLLIPVVVECAPDRAAQVADQHDFFSRCGFNIEQFGPGAVRCTAVPMSAAATDPEVLVGAIIDRLDDRDAAT